MEFIVNNWYIILAAIAAFAVIVVAVVKFFRQPRAEQIKKVKKWLLVAVIEAEKNFGGGTGTLKLRTVYDLFVTRWPWVARIVPFETFSDWVDEALKEMRELLEKNLAIAAYVYGTQEGIDVDELDDTQLRSLLEQMDIELPENALTREEMLKLLDQAAALPELKE